MIKEVTDKEQHYKFAFGMPDNHQFQLNCFELLIKNKLAEPRSISHNKSVEALRVRVLVANHAGIGTLPLPNVFAIIPACMLFKKAKGDRKHRSLRQRPRLVFKLIVLVAVAWLQAVTVVTASVVLFETLDGDHGVWGPPHRFTIQGWFIASLAVGLSLGSFRRSVLQKSTASGSFRWSCFHLEDEYDGGWSSTSCSM